MTTLIQTRLHNLIIDFDVRNVYDPSKLKLIIYGEILAKPSTLLLRVSSDGEEKYYFNENIDRYQSLEAFDCVFQLIN